MPKSMTCCVGGGGTIATGRNVTHETGTPLANLWQSMLRRIGTPVDRFADSTGELKGLDDPNFNGDVAALALQGDGKLLVGGAFGLMAPPGSTAATTRLRLARINVDGTIDAFDPSATGSVFAIALQPDGKILIGGTFTSLMPNGANLALRKYAARLEASGAVDTSFNLDISEQLGNRVDSLRESARERFERLHPWTEYGDCAYIPVCAGGCLVASHTELGDMNLPTCHKPSFESAVLALAHQAAGAA